MIILYMYLFQWVGTQTFIQPSSSPTAFARWICILKGSYKARPSLNQEVKEVSQSLITGKQFATAPFVVIFIVENSSMKQENFSNMII